MKKDIRSYGYTELKKEMEHLGEKAFRAKQVYEWLHIKLADSFDEMTNLSLKLRERMKEEYKIFPVIMEERQISKLDGTNKFLFRLYDGNMVESVLMKYKHGNSVCISSQAGCRMGCVFCASTIGGLKRNLNASEMLGQIYQIQKITGERVSNVVIMGTGEPLDNYDNFVKFIRMLTDEHGLNISQRNVTVSTCGIVPICCVWRMKGFRSRWHFLSMVLPRKKGGSLCLSPTNTTCLTVLPPAIHILRRRGAG